MEIESFLLLGTRRPVVIEACLSRGESDSRYEQVTRLLLSLVVYTYWGNGNSRLFVTIRRSRNMRF